MTQWHDPIVEEVRRIREQQAAELDYDLKAIFSAPAAGRNSPSARRYRLLTPWRLSITQRWSNPCRCMDNRS